MTTQQLINTLSDLNNLHDIPLADIILLKETYPYCQNFHFLEAKKRQLSGDTENLEHFQRLTVMISDKFLLYNRFAHSETEPDYKEYESPSLDEIIKNELFPEEESTTSEFKKKKEVEEILETTPESVKLESLKVKTSSNEDSDLDENIKYIKVPKLKKVKVKNKADKETKPLKLKKVKTKKVKLKEKAKQKTKRKKKIKHKKKSKAQSPSISPVESSSKKMIQEESFSSWLMSLKGMPVKPIESEPLEKEKSKNASKGTKKNLKKKKGKKVKSKKKNSKKKKAKKDKLQKKINSSLERKSAVVSETLAEMMANQGHINQAIDIYQQLSLIYPEKSSYFADQIKKLD